MTVLSSLPFVLMRGGTSKGVFLDGKNLPQDRVALSALLLDVMGSPDRRQIDGLGGADKLTSKVAIISPSERQDADIDYLFAQVGIQEPEVDFQINCGNLTAAAAVYAIEQGLVAGVGHGLCRVRIHNVNTQRVILADVPMRDGRPEASGDFQIDGVPGTGAPIALDFAQAFGVVTGELLPFGSPTSILQVSGLGAIDVSVVDGANLVVFVAARSVGMQGTESPREIDGDAQLVGKLNAIRREVAYRLGMKAYWDSRVMPSTPFCVVVSPSVTYQNFATGQHVHAADVDLVCRQFSTGATSKAMAATVASCTGLAARIPGTVVQQVLAPRALSKIAVDIGHPSGVISVESQLLTDAAGSHRPQSARIFRTARRLADGTVYLKRHDIAEL